MSLNRWKCRIRRPWTAFYRSLNRPCVLIPDQPISIGAFGSPDVFTEIKKQVEEALIGSQKVITEVWKDFKNIFGRSYKPIESYKTKGAETLLVTMGSITETAMTAVDALREKGQKVGLIHIRLWRPFPFKEFFQAIAGGQMPGRGGPGHGPRRSRRTGWAGNQISPV